MKKYNVGDRVIIERSCIEDIKKFAGKIGVIEDVDYPDLNNPYYVHVEGTDRCVWCQVKCLVPNEKIVITHDGKTTTATLYKGDEKVSAEAKCAPEDTFNFMVGATLAMERLVKKATEVVVDGFKVGDRVNYEGHNGTVICINNLDCIGVEFDTFMPTPAHGCGGNILRAGKSGTWGKCCWYNSDMLKHGEVSEPYNGKVVCVDLCGCNSGIYTVGKIYQFVDGALTANNGNKMTNWGKKFHSFEEWSNWTGSKFIEVVE